eukprot:2992848-Rhodomonas_salina.2
MAAPRTILRSCQPLEDRWVDFGAEGVAVRRARHSRARASFTPSRDAIKDCTATLVTQSP